VSRNTTSSTEFKLEQGFRYRLYFFTGLIIFTLTAFILQLFNLQIINGSENSLKAERFVRRSESLPAARGQVYDRNFINPEMSTQHMLISNSASLDVVIGRDRFKSYTENQTKGKQSLSFSQLNPLSDINGRFSPRFRSRTRKRFFISTSDEGMETPQEQGVKNIVILDDGFQHHAIKRDLDFVLVDSNNAFGTGFTIPLGSLRERITAIKRAHYIIFTRYAKENAANVEILKVKFIKINPDLKFYNLAYIPLPLLNRKREILSLESLASKKVVLFSALGNPFSFETLIESYKPKEIKKVRFPDHFAYDKKTMLDLFVDLKNFDILICTEKDYIKIQYLRLENPEMEKVFILPVEVYLNKQAELKADLERLISSKSS
jgi:tetraacyldisaccharide 4'-kinase